MLTFTRLIEGAKACNIINCGKCGYTGAAKCHTQPLRRVTTCTVASTARECGALVLTRTATLYILPRSRVREKPDFSGSLNFISSRRLMALLSNGRALLRATQFERCTTKSSVACQCPGRTCLFFPVHFVSDESTRAYLVIRFRFVCVAPHVKSRSRWSVRTPDKLFGDNFGTDYEVWLKMAC